MKLIDVILEIKQVNKPIVVRDLNKDGDENDDEGVADQVIRFFNLKDPKKYFKEINYSSNNVWALLMYDNDITPNLVIMMPNAITNETIAIEDVLKRNKVKFTKIHNYVGNRTGYNIPPEYVQII